MNYHKCNICKDDIHPANLKEHKGTDGKLSYFHYICFNEYEKELIKAFDLIQKEIIKAKNKLLRKAVIRVILSWLLIYFVLKWFLTRG